MESQEQAASSHAGDPELTSRDAATSIILGCFFLVLAVPVMIATFFEEKRVDQIINVGSGFLIFAVGAGFFLRGRRLGRISATDSRP